MWVNDIQNDIRDVFTENLYNEKTNPNGYKLTRDDAKLILYHMFDITTEFKDGEKVSAWLNKHTWYNPDAKSDEYTPE